MTKTRRALEQQIATDLKRLAGLDADDSRGRDEGDQAQSELNHTLTAAEVAMLTRRIRQCQEALAKITAGTHGRCERCGEAIEPKRLQAVPWALCCLSCQEAAERVDQWERDQDSTPSAMRRPEPGEVGQ